MISTKETTAGTAPVDIDTMRHSISQLLGPDAPPPAGDKLAVLDSLPRGHMQLIIPEIEQAALARDQDDVPRYCASPASAKPAENSAQPPRRASTAPSPTRASSPAPSQRCATTTKP